MNQQLGQARAVTIEQVHELAELFGFETRNKFAIHSETGEKIGYAAEQQKGILGFLFRQFLGHWRRFDIFIFDVSGTLMYRASHPFRWFFTRMQLADANGQHIGAIQKRFSILSKKFVVEGRNGEELMTVSSPIWRIWTFKFYRQGREVALVEKKWAGLLSEAFTDKDKFRISFNDPNFTVENKALLVAAGLFIDLQYFENKASN